MIVLKPVALVSQIFQYDRFIDRKFYTKDGEELKTPLMQFGFMCPGRHYAILKLKWYVLSTLANFDLRLERGEPALYANEFHGHEVLPPSADVDISYRPRPQTARLELVWAPRRPGLAQTRSLRLAQSGSDSLSAHASRPSEWGVGSVRLSLAQSGSVWLSLAQSGSVWLSLAQSGSVWLSLAQSGSVWISLAQSGSVWLSLAQSSSIWLSLTQSGSVWLSLAQSGSVWPSLAQSGSVWTSLAQSGADWIQTDSD